MHNFNPAALQGDIASSNLFGNSVPLFDPAAWLNLVNTASNPYTAGDPVSGNLYELRVGWPKATVLLDATPPKGEVTLNASPGTGGISIHHFAAYGVDVTDNSSGTIQDSSIDNAWEALKFTIAGDQTITGITLQLKISNALSNPSEQLLGYIYADFQATPGTALGSSLSSVYFNALGLSYADVKFNFSTPLTAGTYWFVLNRTAPPAGGSIVLRTTQTGIGTHAVSTDGLHWTIQSSKDAYYKLAGLDSALVPMASRDFLQDALGNTVRQASLYGGAAQEGQYETIGVGPRWAIAKYLTLNSNGTYPVVNSIEIGATATRAKDYVIEVKLAADALDNPYTSAEASPWTALYDMVADLRTRSYIRYTLKTPLPLIAVRIRYRGDYYAAIESGDATVSAKDGLADVVAMQLSHYADMRDAVDFPNADGAGWVPFFEGQSVFNWNLFNASRLWTAQTGTAATGLSSLQLQAGNLLGYDLHKAYLFTPNVVAGLPGTLTLSQSFGTAAITSTCVFQNAAYAGLSSGILMRSRDGSAYTAINTVALAGAITSLAVYRGVLYIGVDAGTGSHAVLYSWDGSALITVRTFSPRSLCSMAAVGSYLYVGLAGETGAQAGAVYQYDGTAWSLTLNTQSDSVDVLAYAAGMNSLWAGLRGGALFNLNFDTGGKPLSWNRLYDTDSTIYSHITESPDQAFVWICASKNLYAYIEATGQFATVSWPAPSTAITDLRYYENTPFLSGNNGVLYQFDASYIASHTRTIYARFKDSLGNITPLPQTVLAQPHTSLYDSIADTIERDMPRDESGKTLSSGALYQLNTDPSITDMNQKVVTTFVSPKAAPLFGPDRKIRESGIYESQPLYAAALTRWDKISFLAQFPACPSAAAGSGLQSGVEVDLYVRTADSQAALLTVSWGQPMARTNIGGGPVGSVNTASVNDFNISSLQGKWLQFRLVLITASRGLTPILNAVTLNYLAANASYFFTKVFDTSVESTSMPPPVIRRFLLAQDSNPNGGIIQFGYTLDDNIVTGNSLDFSRYTVIDPNTVVELPVPQSKIRFGILLVSAGGSPAVVDDFAVQMDTGSEYLKFMD